MSTVARLTVADDELGLVNENPAVRETHLRVFARRRPGRTLQDESKRDGMNYSVEQGQTWALCLPADMRSA